MSIDVERELRLAMMDVTADVHAAPDLLAKVTARPRRRPRALVLVAAAAAVATIAGMVVVAQRLSGTADVGVAGAVKPIATYHSTVDYASVRAKDERRLEESIRHWGSVRGDLSQDAALLQRARQEWAHPSDHPANLGAFEPVTSVGPLQILWAGSTPDGPAVYAVARSHDSAAGYWYGVFLTDAHGVLHLRDRLPLDVGVDMGEHSPYVFSFTTSDAQRAVVAIPYTSTDHVRMAFAVTPAGSGSWQPAWREVSVEHGAAVAPVPADGNVWAGIVEVQRQGRALDHRRVDYVATHLVNDAPPHPQNVLGLWCNGCGVYGSAGPEEGADTFLVWATRHGPAYLPVLNAMWSVGGSDATGDDVIATQLYVPGQPAHTVVVQSDMRTRTTTLLYDQVTDVSARPLFAVRLLHHDGWLVGAGPDAFVTGWRATASDAWHAVARKKALLVPTDADSIQLRLLVNGKQRVVTR